MSAYYGDVDAHYFQLLANVLQAAKRHSKLLHLMKFDNQTR